VALGGEPVRVGDTVVAQVTSGGYGCTGGKSIAYAYLPAARDGAVAVAVDGDWVAAEIAPGPLYDPKGSRSAPDGGPTVSRTIRRGESYVSPW
jgi:4-methylaminobutanoate oxidase (formaldehyde-forming)